MYSCIRLLVEHGWGLASIAPLEHVYVGISEAARCGYAILTGGGSAVDAVEAAVICMENNPIFNAGE